MINVQALHNTFVNIPPNSAILLYGHSGYGKTYQTNQMGAKFGLPVVMYPEGPDSECIWFIDEAQKYKRIEQERIMGWIDEPYVWSSRGKVRIHIVIATTDPDKLILPLRTRCIQFQLTPYTEPELELMIKHDIPKAWKEEISRRAKGNPRTVDYLSYTAKSCGNLEQVFNDWGIDKFGLQDVDRKYLKELLFRGRIPLNQIASLLTLTEETVEETIEPYMKQKGWVKTSSGGRELTPSGKTMAQEVMKE